MITPEKEIVYSDLLSDERSAVETRWKSENISYIYYKVNARK